MWNDANWYRTLLQQLRYGAGLHNRKMLADVIARTIRDEVNLPSPQHSDPGRRETLVSELREHGLCRLGRVLSSSSTDRAREALENCPLKTDTPVDDPPFTKATAPECANIGSIVEGDSLSRCRDLLQVANHPDILSVVEGFLGAPPTVQYYTAWWSFAGRSRARDAQLFHYDRNCFRFVKLFVYLTNVTASSGPHVFVRGSANVERWIKRLEWVRSNDPENANRFLSMINAVRKEDADVFDFFGVEQIETLTGAAGDAFLVDTSGIHKGLLPETDNRLVFQATYALLPLLKEKTKPTRISGFARGCVEKHGRALTPDYIEYVNRIALADDCE